MTYTIHRKARKGPSIKKHGFSAVLFLALVSLSTFSWLRFGDQWVNIIDQPNKEFILPNTEIVLGGGNTPPLPDLLKDENIAPDANPTETLDLLGGPEDPVQAPADKPAVNTPPVIAATPQPNGPQTILIDGKPVNESALDLHSLPLTRAPIQGLSRMSPFGRVPYIAKDGRSVMNSYAKPFAAKKGIKYISVVIGGLGINDALTRRAINELPGTVSLAFAAESPDLQHWVNQARARGHEVLIELPMQSKNQVSASPYTLTQVSSNSANIKNLDYLLSRAEGYFAVTNYGGELIANDQHTLTPILTHIKNAGLGFIYDGEVEGAKINSIGKDTKLQIIRANHLIDGDKHDSASVKSSINSLLETSIQTIPVGMGFSFSGTINGVKNWMDNKSSNTELAPVSYALRVNSL